MVKSKKNSTEQAEISKDDIEQETIDIATATVTGDVRDFLLDRVKTMGKPWTAMSEDDQRDQIYACKSAAEHLVRTVVQVIAAAGRKVIVGQLVKVNVKDKIQAQVDFSKLDEQRHELFDSVGTPVLLVVADAEQFTGERAPAEPIPDQQDMLSEAEKLSNGKVARIK